MKGKKNKAKGIKEMNAVKDWRTDYVVCKHVAKDESEATAQSGFRACCETCYSNGFLESPLIYWQAGEQAIGRIQE